jgi:hypothetical protein
MSPVGDTGDAFKPWAKSHSVMAETVSEEGATWVSTCKSDVSYAQMSTLD